MLTEINATLYLQLSERAGHLCTGRIGRHVWKYGRPEDGRTCCIIILLFYSVTAVHLFQHCILL